jgi:Bacterial PH domain
VNEFPPERQRGLVVHAVLFFVLGAISLTMFWLVFQTEVGLVFTLYILVALLTFIPLPILAYRAYALARGNYTLDRDNLRLIWGLRVEEIPVANVEWVRPASALPTPLTLPWFRLPGGLLGRSLHGDLGSVEFIAAETDTLLLVATARRVYAISPADPAGFIAAFQRAIEMGSLSRVEAHSQYPSFVVAVAWENMIVRYLWMAGAFLNIGLLAWVTVLAPGIQRIPLGFTPAGTPQEAVPGVQLVLLPVLSALLFVTGWLGGLFFYRRPDQRILALSVWASSVISAFFFLIAVFFLITTPV